MLAAALHDLALTPSLPQIRKQNARSHLNYYKQCLLFELTSAKLFTQIHLRAIYIFILKNTHYTLRLTD